MIYNGIVHETERFVLIFISYRSAISANSAGRLYDSLAAKTSRTDLILDVAKLPVGVDFLSHLNHSLLNCPIVLVVVSVGWKNFSRPGEPQRLSMVDDPVRCEILQALESRKLVVPVFMDGADSTEVTDLPDSISSLARIQGHTIRSNKFSHDLDELLEQLTYRFPSLFPIITAERAAQARNILVGAAIGGGIGRAVGKSHRTCDDEKKKIDVDGNHMLVSAVESSSKLSRVSAHNAVETIFEVMSNTLRRRKTVSIDGFGVFKPKTRSSRIGRSSATGEIISVPESTHVNFVPHAKLKNI